MARLRTDATIRGKVRKLESEVADGQVTPAIAAERLAELLQ
jgi:LAO/AO transport system kinase